MLSREITKRKDLLALEKQLEEQCLTMERVPDSATGLPSAFSYRRDALNYAPWGIYRVYHQRGKRGKPRLVGSQMTVPNYTDCLEMHSKTARKYAQDPLVKEMLTRLSTLQTPKVLDLEDPSRLPKRRRRKGKKSRTLKQMLGVIKAKRTRESIIESKKSKLFISIQGEGT